MSRDALDGPGGQPATPSDASFKAHGYPVVLPCCIPDWTMQIIDFQLHGDPRILNYCTTYADHFRKPTHPVMAISKNEQEESLSDSTSKSLVKYSAQDAPRLQQKRDSLPPSSAYNETYQFRWCAPPKPVKQFPAFTIGNQEGTHERETTYNAHFCRRGTICPVIHQAQEHQMITLGEYSKKWTTTTSDFHSAVTTGPVLRVKKDRNFSSVPRGEEDPEQNRKRMTTTSYKLFFSKKEPTEPLVRIDGPSAMTMSNVVLGQLNEEDLPYTTTASMDYPRRTAVRVQPVSQPSGYVVNIQDDGPSLTTMQMDYPPVNGKRHVLSPERLEEVKGCHITPPCNELYFTTAYKEFYGSPKPICWTARTRVPRQQASHMPF